MPINEKKHIILGQYFLFIPPNVMKFNPHRRYSLPTFYWTFGQKNVDRLLNQLAQIAI